MSKAREFAPLKAGAASNAPRLQGVVFDVDGTLCEPQTYMFAEMRAALSIPRTTDILDHIYALPTPDAQAVAMESIRRIERAAMASQVAQPGLAALMAYLDARGVRKAICTRNFDQPVHHLLDTFLAGSLFDPVVTRDFRPPKPHPAGILHIARRWGLTKPAEGSGSAEGGVEVARVANGSEQVVVEVGQNDNEQPDAGEEGKERQEEEVGDASALIMVGDSLDDMTAGRRAGAATVLLVNDVNRHLAEHEHTDLVITRLDELIGILEEGFRGEET